MSIENAVEYIKSNKRSIIKTSLIVVGITTSVSFISFLLKKDQLMTEQYFIDHNQKETLTADDLLQKLVDIVDFEYDNEGQIVIYTGMYRDERKLNEK